MADNEKMPPVDQNVVDNYEQIHEERGTSYEDMARLAEDMNDKPLAAYLRKRAHGTSEEKASAGDAPKGRTRTGTPKVTMAPGTDNTPEAPMSPMTPAAEDARKEAEKEDNKADDKPADAPAADAKALPDTA